MIYKFMNNSKITSIILCIIINNIKFIKNNYLININMLNYNNKLFNDELINEHTKFTLNDMRGE